MSKIQAPTPEFLNFIAANLWSFFTALGAGMVAVLYFLGKNFWTNQVEKPNLEAKEQLKLFSDRQDKQEKELAEVKHNQAIHMIMLEQSLRTQNEFRDKIDEVITILLKQNK